MSVSFSPLHPKFGAEITGVTLSADLTSDEVKLLRGAIERFGVILLRNQKLTDGGMEGLAEALGGAHTFPSVLGTTDKHYRVSNIDVNGRILPPDDVQMRINEANELWHTDTTYQRPRSLYSMLYGVVVPPTGGDTEFCDVRCAYESLSDERKSQLDDMTAYHTLLQSRALTGFTDFNEEQRAFFKPIARPLVELHQPSGRKALCIASHVQDIDPLSRDEAQSLLKELVELATRPEFVYIHKWQAGDLLMWDNRCTMHRARPYAYLSEIRDLRTARVVDYSDR